MRHKRKLKNKKGSAKGRSQGYTSTCAQKRKRERRGNCGRTQGERVTLLQEGQRRRRGRNEERGKVPKQTEEPILGREKNSNCYRLKVQDGASIPFRNRELRRGKNWFGSALRWNERKDNKYFVADPALGNWARNSVPGPRKEGGGEGKGLDSDGFK